MGIRSPLFPLLRLLPNAALLAAPSVILTKGILWVGVESNLGDTARLYMSQFELGLRNPQAALDTLVDKVVENTPRRRASMMCGSVWGC
jgi:hypothetical protein